MTWIKGISKQGKYPKKPFSAILVAAYPSENPNGTKLLQLDFEGDIQVGIYGIGKAEITDDGVEVGGSLAEFQASLETLNYSCLWDTDDTDTEIMGFKTEPNIIGCKVYMSPLEEQIVGDDSQTKKSIFWGIVTKVEPGVPAASAAPVPTKKPPGKLPKKPATEEPKNKVDITGIVIDALIEPKTINELFTVLEKRHKVSELRTAIDSLESQEMIVKSNGKWQVI